MTTKKPEPFLMTDRGSAYLTMLTEDAAQIIDALTRFLGEERIEVEPAPGIAPHADWVSLRVPAKKHDAARAFIAGTQVGRGSSYEVERRWAAVGEAKRRVHEGGRIAPHTDLDPSGVPEGPTRPAAVWVIEHQRGFQLLVQREQRERVAIETASLMGAIFREGPQGLLPPGWYTASDGDTCERKGPFDTARDAWLASLP